MAGNGAHQGVVAVTSAKQYNDLEDVIAAKRGKYSILVVLDGVEDPHNLGAILRTADAAGANGIVIPERRAAAVTGTVTKASAGASEHLPIAKVTNIARTVEELKESNIWTVGLDERATQTYDALDYNMLNASANFSTSSREYTPTTCPLALAGLVRGPSRLNIVRMRNSRRTPCTCFIAGCRFGA